MKTMEEYVVKKLEDCETKCDVLKMQLDVAQKAEEELKSVLDTFIRCLKIDGHGLVSAYLPSLDRADRDMFNKYIPIREEEE